MAARPTRPRSNARVAADALNFAYGTNAATLVLTHRHLRPDTQKSRGPHPRDRPRTDPRDRGLRGRGVEFPTLEERREQGGTFALREFAPIMLATLDGLAAAHEGCITDHNRHDRVNAGLDLESRAVLSPWAKLVERVVGVFTLLCPNCGGRMATCTWSGAEPTAMFDVADVASRPVIVTCAWNGFSDNAVLE